MCSIYCPICGETLEPSNREEVEEGLHSAYIYIHRDVPHTDTDIEALGHKLQ